MKIFINVAACFYPSVKDRSYYIIIYISDIKPVGDINTVT